MQKNITFVTQDGDIYAGYYNEEDGSYFVEYEKCETPLGDGLASKYAEYINRKFKDINELEKFFGEFDAYELGQHLPSISSAP